MNKCTACPLHKTNPDACAVCTKKHQYESVMANTDVVMFSWRRTSGVVIEDLFREIIMARGMIIEAVVPVEYTNTPNGKSILEHALIIAINQAIGDTA